MRPPATRADSVFENLTAEVEVDGEDLDLDLIDEWARRAPVYTFVSLAQDVEETIDTPAEVAGDDREQVPGDGWEHVPDDE